MRNITIEQCINRYKILKLISICADGQVVDVREEIEDEDM